MNLLSFQKAFQAAILDAEEPGPSVLDFLTQPRLTDLETAFGVYYNAYRLRLAEFISTDFAILRNHLGDERFGRLVEDYVTARPSSHRNARWYASGLPEFMAQSAAWSVDREACDLARFERALSDAFDAADAPSLDAQTLFQTDSAHWPNLTFSFHPGMALLDLTAGTVARYESATDDRAPPAASAGDEEEAVLVWRQEYRTFHRIVDHDESLALTESMRSKTFAEVCSLLSFRRNGEDVSLLIGGFLTRWFADGLITGSRFDA